MTKKYMKIYVYFSYVYEKYVYVITAIDEVEILICSLFIIEYPDMPGPRELCRMTAKLTEK